MQLHVFIPVSQDIDCDVTFILKLFAIYCFLIKFKGYHSSKFDGRSTWLYSWKKLV